MDSETAAAPAGIVRRPAGPRSRRPPTHAGVGGAGRAQETAAAEDAAEAAGSALPPLREEATAAEADDSVEELFDGIGECEPAAEKQDEEPADKPAAATPRRLLPRGAVPLLLLPPGGGGSTLKPRLSRTPRPMTTVDTVHEPADSAAPVSAHAATSPATAPTELEPSSTPMLRQRGRPPGIGAAMVSTADLSAIRLQLRRAASPQPAAAPAEPEDAMREAPPQPPRTQPPPRPPPPSLHSLPPLSPPQSPPQPSPRQTSSPPQLPPQLPPKPSAPQLPPPQLPPKPAKRMIVKADSDSKE